MGGKSAGAGNGTWRSKSTPIDGHSKADRKERQPRSSSFGMAAEVCNVSYVWRCS